MADIVEWAGSNFGFYVDRHYIGGRWILQPGPIRLADYHARILAHIFTPDEAGRLPYDTVAWCEPAKSGKSAIAGLVGEFVALHGEQNSAILMASNKQDQAASLMFKSLTDSIEFNPHLRVEPNKYEVGFRNGNTVRAIPSNSRGEAGARFSLALFDELWAYVYQDATRLWTEFKTDPTRLNSLKFAVGYAGYAGESELWQNLLETGLEGQPIEELSDITNEDGSLCCFANGRQFTFWSHTPRQPWQTSEWLASQRKSLRDSEFRRMIKTEFVDATSAFLSEEQISWLVCPELQPLKPGIGSSRASGVVALRVGDWQALADLEYEQTYGISPLVVALDVATKKDTCALASCYWDYAEKRIRLGWHRVWYPPVALSTVEDEIVSLSHMFNIEMLLFDPYQALYLSERLREKGINTVEFTQNLSNLKQAAEIFMSVISGGLFQIYDDDEVATFLQNLRTKEVIDGSSTGFRLVKGNVNKRIDLGIVISWAAFYVYQLYAEIGVSQ